MTMIPEAYLPSKELLPDKIYPLPEVRLPYKLNLADIFLDRHVADGRGENTAIIHGKRKITFSELQNEVNRLANALAARGIEKYDRVMIRMPNRPEFVISCFACWRLGAIPVLTHHLLQKEEIIFRANDSEAKAILVSADTFPAVRDAIKKCPTLESVIVIGKRKDRYLFYDELIQQHSARCATTETTKNDWVRIIYSSGTTGRPKGIISAIGDMVAGVRVANEHLLHITDKDVLGSPPAFTFAFGFFSILFLGQSGCTLNIIEEFTAEKMYKAIEDNHISVLRCVPTGFRMMLDIQDAGNKYDLSSLRLCQSAGEVLPSIVAKEWKKRFGVTILDSMGSADLNSFMSTYVDMPEDKLGSSGMPYPGVDYRLVDNDFQEVPPGSPGELVIRAPWGQLYWRRRDLQEKCVKNGWNRTGLVFEIDEDGYFWFKGRDDDMIVSSGYKIPGGEVESSLLSHHAVQEAAVVPSPDTIRGNIVKAFIVLKNAIEPSDELVDDLKNHVKQRIEPYKYPRKIEFVDGKSLPRTTTGKIQRYVLREKERQNKSQ